MSTRPTLQDTLAELNELAQFFVTAEAAIKKGEAVDMGGIDARVANVCATVQSAIPEQQKLYLPELQTLLSLLDSCERVIRLMQSSSSPMSPTAKEG